MTKKGLRSEWEAKINEFKTSGQSQAAWCKEKKINIHTFNYWFVKFKNAIAQEEKQTSWMPLTVSNSGKNTEDSTINIKIGNVIIDIKHGFDPELLLKVTEALRTLC